MCKDSPRDDVRMRGISRRIEVKTVLTWIELYRRYGLEFISLQAKRYDFVVPKMRSRRSAVRPSCEILDDPRMRERLNALGFRV